MKSEELAAIVERSKAGASMGYAYSHYKQDVEALLQLLHDLESKLEVMRDTNNRLHRRCQEAESAARTKVEEVQRAGPSLGRALAAWSAGDQRRRAEAAESQQDVILGQMSALYSYLSLVKHRHLAPALTDLAKEIEAALCPAEVTLRPFWLRRLRAPIETPNREEKKADR